jgi:hypothetical protein
MLYVAGEDIEAGDIVVISPLNSKAYKASAVTGPLLGNAVERLRKGFRIVEQNGEIREDDA